jgi:hypothetical protein
MARVMDPESGLDVVRKYQYPRQTHRSHHEPPLPGGIVVDVRVLVDRPALSIFIRMGRTTRIIISRRTTVSRQH